MKFASSKLLFFLCSVFVHFIALTFAQTNLLYSVCYKNRGNYTSGDTYQTNLNQLLTSLYTNTSIDYGFYDSTYGETPNQVFAIAQCRPDMKSSSCLDCINKASQGLTQSCPNSKEAIGGYDDDGYNYCMLRYANRNISNLMEPAPWIFVHSKINITEDVEGFKKARKSLLERLQSPAAAGDSRDKSAFGGEQFSNQTIYAYVQCTPDLTQSDCVSCLKNATALLPNCCDTRQGGRIITPSCNFRYEKDIFYKTIADAPAPSPQLPPPPTNAATTKGKENTTFQTAISILVYVFFLQYLASVPTS